MPRKKVIAMKPAGPEQYVPVMRGSKPHYRRGRGTVMPAVLNKTMQSQAEAVKLAMPGAKRLIQELEAHLEHMKRGSLQATMGLRMAGELRRQGYLDYHSLMGLEAQKDYPLEELLRGSYRLIKEEGKVGIELAKGAGIKVRNSLISGYQIRAIMISGDATDAEAELALHKQESAIYPVGDKTEAVSRLALPMPERGIPWMLWLGVECLEDGLMAGHPMYRRMKVVATGRD